MSELRPAATYFVSDVHWQPAGDVPDPLGPFGRFLSAVSERARSGAPVQLYDVAAGTILMEGDVLLTQGANALSSERLTIDLNAGTGALDGRVRTIFTPGVAQ